MFLLRAWGKNLFQAYLSGGLLAFSDVPWLVEASPRSLLSCSLGVLPVYVGPCGQVFPFPRLPVTLEEGPPAMTSFYPGYLCKGLKSNEGHIQRYWGVRTPA